MRLGVIAEARKRANVQPGGGAARWAEFNATRDRMNLRELQEKRLKAAKDAQALLPLTTPEARAKHKAFMDEHDGYKQQIDDLRAAERTQSALDDLGRTERLPEGRVISPGDRLASVQEYRTAMKRFGKKAYEHMTPESRIAVNVMNAEYWESVRNVALGKASAEERAVYEGRAPEFRDMGISVSSLGGYFVPQGFVYDIDQAMKYWGDMLGIAEILDTATGQTLPYPTDNDTTITGEIVAEGAQVTEADVSVGHLNFGAYKFSTKMVKVSLELLQDSAFNLESYLRDKFAIRMGRILNTKFTVGAGTTEPNGIITAIVAGNPAPNAWATQQTYGTPVIAAGSSANDGSANTGANSIGYGDMVNLEHSVDPLYRRGAKYMFHDGTLRFLKTLLDKYGRPLWVPGVTADAPDEICGYDYSINNDMATIAASANTVAFGAMKKYLIRRVKEMSILVLRERYADYGQVAFIGFSRYDGNLIDAGTHPVSYLQQHS